MIYGSENQKQYEKLTNIRAYNLETDRLIVSHSYLEEILLISHPFLKFIRIIFILPLFQFYGINSIRVFSLPEPNLIILGKKNNNEEFCIVNENIGKVFLKSCREIFGSFHQTRYLWTLFNDQTIRPYGNQTLCLQVDIESSSNDLMLDFCYLTDLSKENSKKIKEIEQKIFNDELSIKNLIVESLSFEELLILKKRSQYFIFENMKIRLKNNENMCISSEVDSSTRLESLIEFINSSSSVNHPNYKIENILHDNERYWASNSFSSLPIKIEVIFFKKTRLSLIYFKIFIRLPFILIFNFIRLDLKNHCLLNRLN